ncbi:MAG: hypothetical protein GXO69_00970 [Acidobacteria bacterium]|nr:hypothetical protein [Acidobacteriota bacterium]
MRKIHLFWICAAVLISLSCAKAPETAATMRSNHDSTPVEKQLNPAIRYGGGNGLSLETAVSILNAKGEDDGVRSEYHWIAVHHPDWKVRGQALLQGKHGIYDKIICVRPDGKTVDIYFDISRFFGKW